MSENLELKDLPSGHISATQLEMFRRCPKQYEFRYVEGLKIPPGGSLVVGISTHRGLELDLAQKRLTGDNWPTKQVLEATASAFDDVVEEAKSAFGSVDWDEADPGAEKDSCLDAVGNYHQSVAKAIEPTAVEQSFEMKFNGVAFTLVGRIDVEHKGETVIDFKTTKKYRKSLENEASMPVPFQLSIYQLARPTARELRLDYIIRNKKSTDALTVTFKAMEKPVLNMVLKEIETLSTAIRTGLFYPNPGFGAMNCGMCGYKALCPVWKRATTVVLNGSSNG